MPQLIERCNRKFVANEFSVLRIGELAQYFNCSTWLIREAISRGYQFEFGRQTTPAHYREWMRGNPAPRKAAGSKLAEKQRLERELSQLH